MINLPYLYTATKGPYNINIRYLVFSSTLAASSRSCDCVRGVTSYPDFDTLLGALSSAHTCLLTSPVYFPATMWFSPLSSGATAGIREQHRGRTRCRLPARFARACCDSHSGLQWHLRLSTSYPAFKMLLQIMRLSQSCEAG
jgi:hypothetical protein